MRQREGIVGGIGGFFGRRCVEVDAHRLARRRGADRRAPGQHVFDAYDAGSDAVPTTSTTR